MWYLYISVLSFQVAHSSSQQPFGHSVLGEYYVEWREFGPCPANKRGTNEIFTDLHLSRKHRKSEVVGNLSIIVPFDDTTPLKINFAVLGSNAAWLPNFYSMTFLKGCSDGLESIFKEGWVNFMKSFNISFGCPIPKGLHQTQGYDPDNFLKYSILSKKFFYGRFKVIMEYYSKQNTLMGCTYFVIDILPSWQKKKNLSN